MPNVLYKFYHTVKKETSLCSKIVLAKKKTIMLHYTEKVLTY